MGLPRNFVVAAIGMIAVGVTTMMIMSDDCTYRLRAQQRTHECAQKSTWVVAEACYKAFLEGGESDAGVSCGCGTRALRFAEPRAESESVFMDRLDMGAVAAWFRSIDHVGPAQIDAAVKRLGSYTAYHCERARKSE